MTGETPAGAYSIVRVCDIGLVQATKSHSPIIPKNLAFMGNLPLEINGDTWPQKDELKRK